MKKVLCVCLTLMLLLSCLPMTGGAGAILYTPEDGAFWTLNGVDSNLFAGNATAVFTAPGNGSVRIPEAVVSALPQCISVLPMLMCFSIKCVEKRQILKENGKNPFSLSRTEAAMIFLKSLAAAAGEVLFFFILSKNLL